MPKRWLKYKKLEYKSLINSYFDFLPEYCNELICSYLPRYVPHFDLPIEPKKLLYKTRKEKFYNRHFVKGKNNWY